jgi:hypothetical protein
MKKFIYKISGDEIDYFVTSDSEQEAISEFMELFGTEQTVNEVVLVPKHPDPIDSN